MVGTVGMHSWPGGREGAGAWKYSKILYSTAALNCKSVQHLPFPAAHGGSGATISGRKRGLGATVSWCKQEDENDRSPITTAVQINHAVS
eukprot:363120-Chlamydomonas_euryale.AAC.2